MPSHAASSRRDRPPERPQDQVAEVVSTTYTVVPDLGSEVSQMSPPWRCAMRWHMARPAPLPVTCGIASFARRKRPNTRATCSEAIPMPESRTYSTGVWPGC